MDGLSLDLLQMAAEGDAEVDFLIREERREKLPRLHELWKAGKGRTIPVAGDVRAPGMGIDAHAEEELKLQTDHFFHLAANYDLNADTAPRIATNIEGTRNAVMAANAWRAGCLQHVGSRRVKDGSAGST